MSFFPLSSVLGTELRVFGENVRSHGLGGVRILHPDMGGSFFLNPAVLGFTEGFNFEVFDIGTGINGVQAYNDFKDVNFDGLGSFNGLYGKRLWLGLQGYSAVSFPYFAFGVYSHGFTDFQMNNPAYPVLNLNVQNDYAFVLGFGMPIAPGVSVGINGKRVVRTGGPQALGFQTLNDLQGGNLSTLQSRFTDQGTAYGFDAGLMLKPGLPFDPTVSLTWQDMGDTTFTFNNANLGKPRLEDNMSAAFTFYGDIPFFSLGGGVEYRHINRNDEQLGKKIHMGLELGVLLFDLRAGLYQGYPTYGLGFDLWLMRFDVASYTVERGAYPGQTPDARVDFSMNMSLSFDPSFNFSGFSSTGKPRNVKQRR